jgi:hypothetical protein
MTGPIHVAIMFSVCSLGMREANHAEQTAVSGAKDPR